MKPIGAVPLAFAAGIAMAAGSATAEQAGRGGAPASSMSEMMRGPASEMMHGMPMRTASAALGWERPLLSLALRHRAELGLSADQAKALEALVERFRKEAEQRGREMGGAERELAELLKPEPADLAQVEGRVRAIEKLRADLRIARIRTIAEGRAALTPEQRAKLDALAAGDLQPRRGERHSGATEQGSPGPGGGTRGMEEMHRFMSSERMPQAMTGMMDMAQRMGGGDPMLGMVRMMEMMSMMGGMTGESTRPELPREQQQ